MIGCTSGIRPFRKGGVNLSHDIINGKTIVHNYGHGGRTKNLDNLRCWSKFSLWKLKIIDYQSKSPWIR